jgi:alkylation response protein AidB-like acyl-CoA dehydrogenase
LRTTAVKEGDGYVINGVKQFITSGKNGDVAIVIAVTDKGAGKKGMSAFLVPTSAPRLRGGAARRQAGPAQQRHGTDQLRQLPHPGGEPDRRGGRRLQDRTGSALEGGRIGIAAQSVGMARSALDVAIAYAKDRQSFGTAIFNHQAVGFAWPNAPRGWKPRAS